MELEPRDPRESTAESSEQPIAPHRVALRAVLQGGLTGGAVAVLGLTRGALRGSSDMEFVALPAMGWAFAAAMYCVIYVVAAASISQAAPAQW